jgi:uncharacterized membrane protein YjfL (UPF0719 family)
MARTVILCFICVFIGWLGIRILDALTPSIPHREHIGENPISIALFIAGFFILIGLVIHGTLVTPILIGAPLVENLIDPTRLTLLAVSFFISLLIGIALFQILNKLTPKIPFLKIKENPVAVGIYTFSYLIFLGLVIHASLTTAI